MRSFLQVRSIMLVAVGVLVVAVFVKLLLDSHGEATPTLKDAELEKALSSYRQGQAQSTRSSAKAGYVAPRRKVDKVEQVEAEVVEPDEPEKTYQAPMPELEEEVFSDKVALKNQMNQANRYYDKADYEGARDAALEVLANNPDNVRMLRIVVSSSCIMAEEEMAARYYETLPDRDKRQMANRCSRYGIELEHAQ